MTILRFRYSKEGKIRFTSHRDVARIWERSLRVAQVPMAYSEGFSPRPRISFGLALPTGGESDGEYIDVIVDDHRDLPAPVDALPALLTAALPPGLAATGVAEMPKGTPSLQQAVTSCVWDITVEETIERANEWSQGVLAAPSIVVRRERKGKQVTDDLRPMIRSLEVLPPADVPGGAVLRADLATQPRSVRPSELLHALEPALTEVRVRRRHQWIELNGAHLEPLQVGAATAPHTEACAS